MEYLKSGWFTFQGRARRKEYWAKTLAVGIPLGILNGVIYLISFLLKTLITSQDLGCDPGVLAIVVDVLYYVATGVVNLVGIALVLGVQVRRLHDRNMPGWVVALLVLVSFIPCCNCIGGLFQLIVLGCLDGVQGANAYGPDPKAMDVAA